MKILFAIQRLDVFGGTERAITNIANEYAKHGCEVTVMTIFSGSSVYTLEEGVKRVSVEDIAPAERDILNKLRKLKAMRKLVRAESPDAVISFHRSMNMLVLAALLGSGVPVIVSERSDPRGAAVTLPKRIARRLLYPFASGYVFQTDQALSCFSKRIQRRSTLISNPVRDDLPEVGVKRFDNTVTAAGRLVTEKGFDTLIKAFVGVAEKNDKYELDIYGEGPLRDELESLIRRFGLEERVHIIPPTERFHELIKDSSLFVLSSRSEGMPNVLLETLCMGIPAVATRCPCGGAEQLVNDGENGFLVAVDDVAAMTEKMLAILGDGELMRRMSAKAVETRQNHRSEDIYAQWREYTDSVIGSVHKE